LRVTQAVGRILGKKGLFMKTAQEMLLPKLEGTLEDWIQKKDDAWQKNKTHWGFWYGVILLNAQHSVHLTALRRGRAVSIIINVILLAMLLVQSGGR
jgi:hypothetical protein